MARTPVIAIAAVLAVILWAAPVRAQNAYISNSGAGTVSVIDTVTNAVIGGPIAVGSDPIGLAVTPDGGEVYVANNQSDNVTVISTVSNTITDTIFLPGGGYPVGVA